MVWLYYKLYGIAPVGGVEHLLLATHGEIKRTLESQTKWFFLRYVDQGGIHLRVRYRVDDEVASEAHTFLYSTLSAALRQPLTIDSLAYRPAVLTRSRFDVSELRISAPQVAIAQYQPEVELFGTESIDIAESFFCASSELTLALLKLEALGLCDRKTMVPWLMFETCAAFLSPNHWKEHWRRYASYWLSVQSEPEQDWMPRFMKKANQMRSDQINLLTSPQKLNENARALLDEWVATCRTTAHAYSKTANCPPIAPILSQLTHLTNNRLGLLPLEEAYFATLLAEQEEAV